MPIDISTNQPANTQWSDDTTVPIDGSVIVGKQPPLHGANTQQVVTDGSTTTGAPISSLSDTRLAHVNASTMGFIYGATAGKDVAGATPTLPHNTILTSDSRDAAYFTSSLGSNGGQGFAKSAGAFSSIAAFILAREAGEKTYDLGRRSTTTMEQGQLAAQTASAKDAIKKAEGDLASAELKFVGSMVGTGAAAYVGAKGTGAIGNVGKDKKNDVDVSSSAAAQVKAQDVSLGKSNLARAEDDLTKKTFAKKKALGESSDPAAQAAKDANDAPVYMAEKQKALDEKVEKNRSSVSSVLGDVTNKISLKGKFEGADGASKKHAALPAGTTPPIGASEDQKLENVAASKAGWSAASQSVSSVITGGTDVIDQSIGGAYESKQADIASKVADLQNTSFKMMLDNDKATKDKAGKMVDDAITALKSHFDLVKSTNDNIGR